MEGYSKLAAKGRNGDTELAHVAKGEMIVPPTLSPELIAEIKAEMAAQGMNPDEFTVGDGDVKINPETGQPEFFFKKLKKIFKIAAPIAASYFGGPLLGSALGSATAGGALAGAGASLLGGGGLKGALQGAVLGGITPNLGDIGNYVSKSASGALDSFGKTTGLSDIFSSASGALGDAYGGISDAIGKAYNGSAVQDVYKSGVDALKSAGFSTGSDNIATAPMAGGGGASSYGNSLNSPYLDSLAGAGKGAVDTGINGFNTVGAFDGALNTGATQMANNYSSPILSSLLGTYTNNKAEDALLKQQAANRELFAPYQNFSFTPGDLTQDPGYQFNLNEGNKAIDRAQLARGGYFSGNAAKELGQFSQGLADNTYKDAFNRALQTQGAGLQGAAAMAGVNENIGNIKANSATNTGNLYSGALGSILGGDTYDNTGALQGGRGDDFLTNYLRQLEMQRLYGAA